MNDQNTPMVAPEPEASGVAAPETHGVKPLAFRIAAGFLITSSVVSLAGVLLGSPPNILSVVIDIGLAIGLLRLSAGARSFTLFRAWAGGLIWPIVMFFQYDAVTAIILSVIQVAYCGSLILILQRETKDWKIYTSVGIFVVFVLCAMSTLFLLALLGTTL